MCLDRGHHAPADAWLRASGAHRRVESGHPTQRTLRVLPERRRGRSVQRPGEPDDRPDTTRQVPASRDAPQPAASARMSASPRRPRRGRRRPRRRRPGPRRPRRAPGRGPGDRQRTLAVAAGAWRTTFRAPAGDQERGRSTSRGGRPPVLRTRHGSVRALGRIDADPHVRPVLGALGEPLDARQQPDLLERDRASIERKSIDLGEHVPQGDDQSLRRAALLGLVQCSPHDRDEVGMEARRRCDRSMPAARRARWPPGA